jgi:2-iminobutanoate/2-iminopropanoate deaminase
MKSIKKEVINIKGILPIKGPISHVIRAGNFVFTSGQIPVDLKTGEVINSSITDKAHAALKNLKLVLETARASLDSVVKVTVFISNLDNVLVFNEIYNQYFKENYPVRSCVEVSRLANDVEFEIEAIAIVNK